MARAETRAAVTSAPARGRVAWLRPAARRGSPVKKARYGLLFVSPAIVFFGVFYLFPLGWALYISFTD
jgi:hypothetical protein